MKRTQDHSVMDVNSQMQDSSLAYMTPNTYFLTMSRQPISTWNTELGAFATTHTSFTDLCLKGTQKGTQYCACAKREHGGAALSRKQKLTLD